MFLSKNQCLKQLLSGEGHAKSQASELLSVSLRWTCWTPHFCTLAYLSETVPARLGLSSSMLDCMSGHCCGLDWLRACLEALAVWMRVFLPDWTLCGLVFVTVSLLPVWQCDSVWEVHVRQCVCYTSSPKRLWGKCEYRGWRMKTKTTLVVTGLVIDPMLTTFNTRFVILLLNEAFKWNTVQALAQSLVDYLFELQRCHSSIWGWVSKTVLASVGKTVSLMLDRIDICCLFMWCSHKSVLYFDAN